MKVCSLVYHSNSSAIYSIVNLVNNKMYVGSAVKLINRQRTHVRQLLNNNHHCKPLQNAFNKYGTENFSFQIIELVNDKNSLIEREQNWIDFFNPEYNVCKKAGSTLGFKYNEEDSKKMSQIRKGKIFTEEHRKNIGVASLGRKHSDESIMARSEKLKGKSHHTAQSKQKISLAMKGRVLSDETKLKMSQWQIGRKMSEQAKENMRDAAKKRKPRNKHTEETKIKMSISAKKRNR